jgi:hypothetical protein
MITIMQLSICFSLKVSTDKNVLISDMLSEILNSTGAESTLYPNCLVLAKIYLLQSPTSVAAERGGSLLGAVKKHSQTLMGQPLLNQSLYIAQNIDFSNKEQSQAICFNAARAFLFMQARNVDVRHISPPPSRAELSQWRIMKEYDWEVTARARLLAEEMSESLSSDTSFVLSSQLDRKEKEVKSGMSKASSKRKFTNPDDVGILWFLILKDDKQREIARTLLSLDAISLSPKEIAEHLSSQRHFNVSPTEKQVIYCLKTFRILSVCRIFR